MPHIVLESHFQLLHILNLDHTFLREPLKLLILLTNLGRLYYKYYMLCFNFKNIYGAPLIVGNVPL